MQLQGSRGDLEYGDAIVADGQPVEGDGLEDGVDVQKVGEGGGRGGEGAHDEPRDAAEHVEVLGHEGEARGGLLLDADAELGDVADDLAEGLDGVGEGEGGGEEGAEEEGDDGEADPQEEAEAHGLLVDGELDEEDGVLQHVEEAVEGDGELLADQHAVDEQEARPDVLEHDRVGGEAPHALPPVVEHSLRQVLQDERRRRQQPKTVRDHHCRLILKEFIFTHLI